MAEQESSVERLFDGALQLPADQRGGFLERECPNDPGMREQVLELIASYEQDSEAFLPKLGTEGTRTELAKSSSSTRHEAAEGSVTAKATTLAEAKDTVAQQAMPDDTIGDHRIIREIARGGMGIVYEAQHLKLKRVVQLDHVQSGRRTVGVLGSDDRRTASDSARCSCALSGFLAGRHSRGRGR